METRSELEMEGETRETMRHGGRETGRGKGVGHAVGGKRVKDGECER